VVSTTSKYSDGWNSPRNAAGEKHMIMVRVVTGDYCKGDNSLKTAPYKPGSKTEQYDSVVDDVSNPTKYVVYHDASAYPEMCQTQLSTLYTMMHQPTQNTL